MSRRARVQDFGDVGMVHHRQRLALGFEARDDRPRVHAQFNHLQRHQAAHRFFLFRHVNGAATAFADFLQDFIMPDLRPRLFLFESARQIARRPRIRVVGGRSQRGDALGEQFFGVGRGRRATCPLFAAGWDRRRRPVPEMLPVARGRLAFAPRQTILLRVKECHPWRRGSLSIYICSRMF